MSENTLAIGIDFGGTSVKAGVVRGAEIIDLAPPIATQDFEGPDQLIQVMARAVEDLRSRHEGIAAIGIGLPGFVDFKRGVVTNLTNVRGWIEIPLKEIFQSITGLPVTLDNDANCMAFAEYKLGAAKSYEHVICVALGTGVGGGVIADGKMIRGAKFGAGEIGQTSIDYQGRRGHYGNLGALEDYIGNQEISRDALRTYKAAGVFKDLEDCTPAALAIAAKHGDTIAIEHWNLVGRMLATAMMNACWLLNPEALVIGGGVARAGNLLFDPFREHLLSQLSGPFRDELAILPAAFGHEAGTIGAAALALDEAGFVNLT
ncbi:ROK family protein [Luteolibacter sp. AS25]|uniref:ROK family protein n=1 Tax=Luteolibacter sp. AS25 TaxID=3135776 RepID=UPI00398B8A1C